MRAGKLEGGAFLTSFARPDGMTASVPTTDGTMAQYDVVWQTTGQIDTYNNLVDLYFGQAEVPDGAPIACEKVGATLAAADAAAEVSRPHGA